MPYDSCFWQRCQTRLISNQGETSFAAMLHLKGRKRFLTLNWLKDFFFFCLLCPELLWCFNTYSVYSQDSSQLQQLQQTIKNIRDEQSETQSSLSLLVCDSKQGATSAPDKINFIVTQGWHQSVCLQHTAIALSYTFLSNALVCITDYHFHCSFDLIVYSAQHVYLSGTSRKKSVQEKFWLVHFKCSTFR